MPCTLRRLPTVLLLLVQLRLQLPGRRLQVGQAAWRGKAAVWQLAPRAHGEEVVLDPRGSRAGTSGGRAQGRRWGATGAVSWPQSQGLLNGRGVLGQEPCVTAAWLEAALTAQWVSRPTGLQLALLRGRRCAPP